MQCLLCVLALLADGGQSAESAPIPVGQGQAEMQGHDPSGDDIVVTGRRGAAEIPPEIELGTDEIDAFGAYDIGEVVRRTAEAHALGDAPVIIVNGRRMADPGALLGFPPDALVRVEVLPREAGALYGGDPSRRVLNVVLERRFGSRDGQLDAEVPTAGGMSRLAGDLRRGMITGNNTTQFGIRASRDSALLGAERMQYVENHLNQEAVSLRPSTEMAGGNMALTRALGDWSASLNVQAQARRGRSVSLSDGVPIESRDASRNLSVTGGLSGELAGWSLQASLTGQGSAYSRSGLADTDSRQRSLTATLSANRAILSLPTGPVAVSLTARAAHSRMVSKAAGLRQTFSAHDLGLAGTMSIPLLGPPSPGEGSAIARLLGGMSATLGANLRQSDSGKGRGLNAGLVWFPMKNLRLNGIWSSSTDSVPEQQRFAPEYYGSPITIFDFSTGEAAKVLPILGGTSSLQSPRFDRLSLSAFVGPFTAWNLTAGAGLQKVDAINSIGPPPAVTPELEAVFPERFQRDAAGRLIVIDQRPINFDSTRTKVLTSNFSASFPLGHAVPGKRRGALRLALNQTWQLRNVTRIHADLREMDRLSGDGGGSSRHQFDIQVDGRYAGWGVNIAARWRGGYRVRRESGRDSSGDLLVAAAGTVDLRLSYALEPSNRGAVQRRGAGVQFGLEVANLFDFRPEARLGNGGRAPGYGRDDQDPVGRTLRLTIRSRF